jgi:hypothetical protein
LKKNILLYKKIGDGQNFALLRVALLYRRKPDKVEKVLEDWEMGANLSVMPLRQHLLHPNISPSASRVDTSTQPSTSLGLSSGWLLLVQIQKTSRL